MKAGRGESREGRKLDLDARKDRKNVHLDARKDRKKFAFRRKKR